MAGYVSERRQIGWRLVQRAANEVIDTSWSAERRRWLQIAAAIALTSALLLISWGLLGGGPGLAQ